MYTLRQIAAITGSTFAGHSDTHIHFFLTDSRDLHSAPDTLFIALKTRRNNGHYYIHHLLECGVKAFLIAENEFDHAAVKHPDASFIISQDPLKALQVLAAYHRRQFSIPVIGVTGSNGKTVVKEWLYQLLKNEYSICRSPKSYNSQTGVPLSVLNLNATHTLAIFEAGISEPGEMVTLTTIIQPTLGVFTSIGSAHDEGFKSRSQKIEEKMILFSKSGRVIINGLKKTDIPKDVLAKSTIVSESAEADLRLDFKDHRLHLKDATTEHLFEIPFSDQASINNAATCAAVLLELGFSLPDLTLGLMNLQAVALRLELKSGIQNSLLINDYYNSDLDSIKIALSYLQQQNRRLKKMVIISDIEQSGISSENLYGRLADLFTLHKIDLVVGVGKEINRHKHLFKDNSLFFDDTLHFISRFKTVNYQFSDASILLKGARSFGFENISRLLQLKSHDTVFEVNLNRLANNVNYYRSLLTQEVQVMCMVKAMGYGSGSVEIARTLQHIGVHYLAVAYADEGVELKQAQVSLPILVMSPEENAFDDIVTYRLEPELYNFSILSAFAKHLDLQGITEPYPVHLKIDTGMHRLGFEEKDLEALIQALNNYPQLKVKTIFSHLVGSDSEHLDDFTKEQMRVFEKTVTFIEKEIGYTVVKHLCNSAGISRFKAAHYDMVRLGIGMYGIGINSTEQLKLENVGILKTRISQIKEVSKGQSVGYSRNGRIEKDTVIATIPIGYADGFSCLLGNGKHGVYIQGVFCRTVGNICMDMSMVDISSLNCREGDEVIIFENVEQINALAKAMQSIPYEVLTHVSGRVKRIYVQE